MTNDHTKVHLVAVFGKNPVTCIKDQDKRLDVFLFVSYTLTLLLDRRSIDLNGAQEKEGHFHYKNFLRASK